METKIGLCEARRDESPSVSPKKSNSDVSSNKLQNQNEESKKENLVTHGEAEMVLKVMKEEESRVVGM